MDNFQVKEILETFQVIADTREQNTPRAVERFDAFGAEMQRATLRYGDYCWNVRSPDGWFYDTSKTITPLCVIERKMSLDELAACFTRDRDRFKREFERASAAGAKIYLLIENGSYEAILRHRYRSKYHHKAFFASLMAWAVRYDMTPVFCKASTSGKLIREILYRDIKERLERGDYG